MMYPSCHIFGHIGRSRGIKKFRSPFENMYRALVLFSFLTSDCISQLQRLYLKSLFKRVPDISSPLPRLRCKLKPVLNTARQGIDKPPPFQSTYQALCHQGSRPVPKKRPHRSSREGNTHRFCSHEETDTIRCVQHANRMFAQAGELKSERCNCTSCICCVRKYIYPCHPKYLPYREALQFSLPT